MDPRVARAAQAMKDMTTLSYEGMAGAAVDAVDNFELEHKGIEGHLVWARRNKVLDAYLQLMHPAVGWHSSTQTYAIYFYRERNNSKDAKVVYGFERAEYAEQNVPRIIVDVILKVALGGNFDAAIASCSK